MAFKKAVRKQARLRLALTGPSGSGKTLGALLIARGIGGSIAVIDTEKGSASLYSDRASFDVMELEAPYSPERFINAIAEAERAGYESLIIDSLTHEWSGVGGCLEINDALARAKFKGNTWSAWNETTPRHRALLDAILSSKLHIIVTLRSKTETSQVEEGGRKKVVKLGMKAEQRDGFEYEMTTVLDLTHEGHYAVASKDRTGLFSDKDPHVISHRTGEVLLDWLNSGEECAPSGVMPVSEKAAQTINNPGTHSPAGDAFERMSPEEQDFLRGVSTEIGTILEADGGHSALGRLEEMKLDNDEKTALWTLFDSKQRAALKKAYETTKAGAPA